MSTIFSQQMKPLKRSWRQVSEEVKKAAGLAEHLLDSADSLLTTTEIQLDLMRRIEKLHSYAHTKNDQDTCG